MVLMYYADCTASNFSVLQDFLLFLFTTSRGNVVGIVTRLWAAWSRNRGSISGRGKRFISIPQRPDQFWGQTPFQWGHLQETKRPRHAAGHLTHVMARLGMSADITHVYVYALMACVYLHQQCNARWISYFDPISRSVLVYIYLFRSFFDNFIASM
jgi:hypothetical protein